MPKITDIGLFVNEDCWKFGFITDGDCFHAVLTVISENGFPADSRYANMPLNEAISESLAWVSDIKNPDDLIDDVIKQLSKLRSRPYPTV